MGRSTKQHAPLPTERPASTPTARAAAATVLHPTRATRGSPGSAASLQVRPPWPGAAQVARRTLPNRGRTPTTTAGQVNAAGSTSRREPQVSADAEARTLARLAYHSAETLSAGSPAQLSVPRLMGRRLLAAPLLRRQSQLHLHRSRQLHSQLHLRQHRPQGSEMKTLSQPQAASEATPLRRHLTLCRDRPAPSHWCATWRSGPPPRTGPTSM